MPGYRAYRLNPSGHFASVEEIEAPSDEAAVEMITALWPEQAFEVWAGARVVHRSESDQSRLTG